MITEEDKNTLWLESLSGKNKSPSSIKMEDVNEALLVRKALFKRRLILEKEMENTDPSTLIKIEKKLDLNGFLKDSLAYKTQQFFKNNFKAFGSGVLITYLISLTFTVETVTYRGMLPVYPNDTKTTLMPKNKVESEYTLEISETSKEPYALANAIQSRAWASGLKTISIPEANGINLYIKDLDNDQKLAKLKMELDISPNTTGTIKIKIIKK